MTIVVPFHLKLLALFITSKGGPLWKWALENYAGGEGSSVAPPCL